MEGTYLVTGAASGIGAAIARRLAGAGARLALHTGKSRDRLESVATICRAKGAECKLLLGELAEPATPVRLIEETTKRFGGLDGLIANAGFADKHRLADLEDDTFAYSLDVIAKGFYRMAKAAAPHLAQSKHGRIVGVSSFVAHVFRVPGAQFTASAAAKAALEGFAKSVAVQLAPHGITVNCVVPGFIQKDAGTHAALDPEGWKRVVANIPLGRLGQPDDVAATVYYLLTPDAAYITGQSIHVDGGLTL
jgi:NAD(P)-dependent dehydrogenase (short-subunit alcohol dehydrogenase family)